MVWRPSNVVCDLDQIPKLKKGMEHSKVAAVACRVDYGFVDLTAGAWMETGGEEGAYSGGVGGTETIAGCLVFFR